MARKRRPGVSLRGKTRHMDAGDGGARGGMVAAVIVLEAGRQVRRFHFVVGQGSRLSGEGGGCEGAQGQFRGGGEDEVGELKQ